MILSLPNPSLSAALSGELLDRPNPENGLESFYTGAFILYVSALEFLVLSDIQSLIYELICGSILPSALITVKPLVSGDIAFLLKFTASCLSFGLVIDLYITLCFFSYRTFPIMGSPRDLVSLAEAAGVGHM